MKFAGYALLLVLAGTLQAAVLPMTNAAVLRPDLLMALAVCGASRLSPREALAVCWAAGLVKDLFSVGAPGAYSLLGALAALAIVAIRYWTDVRGTVAQAILAFVFTAGTECVYFTVVLAHAGIAPKMVLFRPIWACALSTAVLTSALGWLLDGFGRHIGIRWEGRGSFA
jgi:rod shape-determining protein MreD